MLGGSRSAVAKAWGLTTGPSVPGSNTALPFGGITPSNSISTADSTLPRARVSALSIITSSVKPIERSSARLLSSCAIEHPTQPTTSPDPNNPPAQLAELSEPTTQLSTTPRPTTSTYRLTTLLNHALRPQAAPGSPQEAPKKPPQPRENAHAALARTVSFRPDAQNPKRSLYKLRSFKSQALRDCNRGPVPRWKQ